MEAGDGIATLSTILLQQITLQILLPTTTYYHLLLQGKGRGRVWGGRYQEREITTTTTTAIAILLLPIYLSNLV